MHPFPDSDCGSFPRPHSATGICYCLPDRFCGRVEIGRQARLRIWCASVWVRVPSPARDFARPLTAGLSRAWAKGLRRPTLPHPQTPSLGEGAPPQKRRCGPAGPVASLRCAFSPCFAHAKCFGALPCAFRPVFAHGRIWTTAPKCITLSR